MNKGLSILLLLTIVVATGYWYQVANSTCNIPLNYRIGEIDARFNLTEDEARSIVSDAESLWEDATGENLFTYNRDADFAINFVFDDRQKLTDAEGKFSNQLESKERVHVQLQLEYESLKAEYDALRATYEVESSKYEERLREHNAEVAKWNNEGGAPPKIFERLQKERAVLNSDSTALNKLIRELDSLIGEINTTGDILNKAVEEYNRDVAEYNSRFNGHREFTQGDYQGNDINIYQFSSRFELTTVLAHEMGHALDLEHVENEQSIMYYLMEGQHRELVLSPYDLEEFKRVCGE